MLMGREARNESIGRNQGKLKGFTRKIIMVHGCSLVYTNSYYAEIAAITHGLLFHS